MARGGNRSAASWVFGLLLLAFLVWVFVFAPDMLPEYKQRMLGIFLASLAGLFAFFLTGDIGLEIQSLQSRFGNLGVKATGGIGVFVLVLVWWWSPLTPIGIEKIEKKVGEIKQDTGTIRQDTGKIVVLLQEELSVKNTQIIFLQGQVERLQAQAPSPRARELAAQIPSDADAYALALKAIAESRFDDARVLLAEAQQAKEVELVRIYQARGETEMYAGRYGDAVGWYEKALAFNRDDLGLLNATAVALLDAGQYAKAEPLLQRALTIWEKVLGPEHPDVATSLNNLALLYRVQGQYAKAEPLYQRALTIWEKALGPEHPDVALSLNNLAGLYQDQGQYAKAEPLYQRALVIAEKALGPTHSQMAIMRKNYEALLQRWSRETR
jgi:tetratricopeptide (TPR) repeat protein